jgi:cupin 2 domain-containing protein
VRKKTLSRQPDQARLPPEETFEPLLSRQGVLIERIISHGNVTPAAKPYCQPHDEWVMVVSGVARLLMDGKEHSLNPGDHLFIPAGMEHWVTYTSQSEATVWLAVHFPTADITIR